jgi:hypothetical protein
MITRHSIIVMGMLRLTVPLKESVKPRRIQIETEGEDQKRLVGAR